MTTRVEIEETAFESKVNLVRPVLPDFEELAAEIRGILQSGMVTKGIHLRAFEAAVAEHLQVKHAVAVSSCTAGLMLLYRTLELTGEVIVPSFTFMATVSALLWAGVRPVFADVDLGSTTLDPESVERSITSRTSAIVATHNFGNPASVDELQAIADRHGLALIFDAAHGFGALYQGQPVGSQGNGQAFSLSPTKLVIAGEGGIVSTENDRLAEMIRIGREYGNSGKYDSAFAGMNARLPEFNALLGLHSLQRLERAAVHRNHVADMYRETLGRLPGIGFQRVRPGDRCSYKDFSITIDSNASGLSRDEVASGLATRNIDTRTYYDPPVHRHQAYRRFAEDAVLPNTDLLAARSLSLPIWSDMDDRTVYGICRAFEDIWNLA